VRKIPPRQTATELAYQAILDEVCEGALGPGTHLVQENLAERLGVSRQPIQQAMAMLKADGIVEEQGLRGLYVAPLDLDTMRDRYDIRAVLDELAARRAAGRVQAGETGFAASGRRLIAEGRAAVDSGDLRALIAADVSFHRLIYDVSGNPLIAPTAEPHWRFLRRVMGDVLRQAEPPAEIWNQHAGILDAVLAGDVESAGERARDHVIRAADRLAGALAAMAARRVN
jgi:DNA-binding GntR family transcriptional regulator